MATAAKKAPAALKPPEKVSALAARFVPTDAPLIINMEIERKAVEAAMRENLPLILVGHTGIAKTKLLQRVHQELAWPYRAITAHGQVEVDTLVGKWIADKDGMHYNLGILPFCMKNGIATGIQEINVVLPEVLVLLHEYVDDGYITLTDLPPEHEDFIIHPHPNFRLYGTMNPPELYAGTRELSPALTRRCLVRQVSPLSVEDEVKVLADQAPHIDTEVARQMANVASSIRQQFDTNQGLFWASTADLVMWARLCKHMSPYDAAEVALIGKAPANEVDFVKGRVRVSFEPDLPTPAAA